MAKTPATLLCDFYKVSHREQYPKGTEYVYSTWTPRTSRIKGIDKVVAFGFQGFIKEYLIDYFNENFFSRDKVDIIEEYKRVIKYCLFVSEPDTQHIEDLHDLGYLPIEITALPEGTLVPIRVPMLTICNTDKRFFWLTNYLETLLSCELWQPSTSATLAYEYKKLLTKWVEKTGGDLDFVQFQGHDFSMRGMGSLESAKISGAGHLTSFSGTDSVPAILYLEDNYGADISKGLVGCSVNATEHSVMCAGGKNDEFETYRRLIEDVYPTGIVSIVSDTWDLWNTLTDIIPRLKESIILREGKVVIRPDSGDPVDIICGLDGFFKSEGVNLSYSNYIKDFDHEVSEPAFKGVIELLWDTFGGTINDKGYKVLDPHIGAIYGDAITLDRCEQICSRLAAKGFASTNIVFGIGSFTYQYNTRDTFGFALKSTHVTINGKEYNIFKDPITDDGTKKSQTGRVVVLEDKDGELYFEDGFTYREAAWHLEDKLQTILDNGKLCNETTLDEVRGRLCIGTA